MEISFDFIIIRFYFKCYILIIMNYFKMKILSNKFFSSIPYSQILEQCWTCRFYWIVGCKTKKNLETWTLSTLRYCFSGDWKKLISKVVMVKINDNSKLLLLYLKFGMRVGCGCLFYMRDWSTTLPCLIVGGGIIWGGGGFSSKQMHFSRWV